jgi:hypothetical protein
MKITDIKSVGEIETFLKATADDVLEGKTDKATYDAQVKFLQPLIDKEEAKKVYVAKKAFAESSKEDHKKAWEADHAAQEEATKAQELTQEELGGIIENIGQDIARDNNRNIANMDETTHRKLWAKLNPAVNQNNG